jgi:hypothetical protein
LNNKDPCKSHYRGLRRQVWTKDVTPKFCRNTAPARGNSAYLTWFRTHTCTRMRECGNSAVFPHTAEDSRNAEVPAGAGTHYDHNTRTPGSPAAVGRPICVLRGRNTDQGGRKGNEGPKSPSQLHARYLVKCAKMRAFR